MANPFGQQSYPGMRGAVQPPSQGGGQSDIMAQLIQALMGGAGGAVGGVGKFLGGLFPGQGGGGAAPGGGGGVTSQTGGFNQADKSIFAGLGQGMGPSAMQGMAAQGAVPPGMLAPGPNPGSLDMRGGGGPSGLASQFGLAGQGTPGPFSMARGNQAVPPEEATLSESPLGASSRMPMAVQDQMPQPGGGAEGGQQGMSDIQKAMMRMMMNQQRPAGNQFSNPYKSGPDWGNGLSQAIQQFKLSQQMKKLGM